MKNCLKLIFLIFISVFVSVNSAFAAKNVELSETKLDTPLDVPIDFLRTSMVDSFKVRFTLEDEQKIINLRKTGGSPCLHVTVNNNGPQLLVLLNFQTTNLSATNLKPYQVTTSGGSEVHKFKLNALPERFYVPQTITLFVFVPRAATRTGKFTLTTAIQDLAVASSSSSTGGSAGGSAGCQLHQGAGGTCEELPGGGAELSTFILISGPNSGTILTAQGNVVSPTLNVITQANGIITDAMPVTPEKGCPKQHFHGSLFGMADPDSSMCGQGKVQKLSATSTYFKPLSDAILLEMSAIEEMKEPDYTEALSNIESAITKLGDFDMEFNKQLLATEAMVTLEELMILQREFPCADTKDKEAKELLVKLKNNTAELFDETKASKLITEALRCKDRMLKLLIRLERRKQAR